MQYVLATLFRRSHTELQKECTRLQQKCQDQEGYTLALEATAGQVEQRCRELERQVKGVRCRHKRAMKTIFNIVMEKEGQEEGSPVDVEEVCACLCVCVSVCLYVAS